MAVSRFLQQHSKFISILEGGYASLQPPGHQPPQLVGYFSGHLVKQVPVANHQPPGLMQPLCHRRRIKTEEKVKVVAYVWGAEFIQFLAALAVLHWPI